MSHVRGAYETASPVIGRAVFRLGVIALLMLAAPVASAQKQPAALSLRPDWAVGQQCRYRVEQIRERTQTLQAGGKKRQATTTTNVTSELTWRVNTVNSDGRAAVTVQYAWLRMAITGPKGNKQVNDSRDGSGDVAAVQSLLEALAGTPLEADIAADGTVQSVAGVDAVRNELEAAGLAPSKQDLRRTIALLAPLPAAPSNADTGTSWNHAFSETHPLGKMQYDASYEIAGLETIATIPIATVTITADMQLEPRKPPQTAKGPKPETRLLDSSYQSQVIFDLLRREAVGRYTHETQTIEQTLSMRGKTLTQRMIQRIESSLLRIDEGG